MMPIPFVSLFTPSFVHWLIGGIGVVLLWTGYTCEKQVFEDCYAESAVEVEGCVGGGPLGSFLVDTYVSFVFFSSFVGIGERKLRNDGTCV